MIFSFLDFELDSKNLHLTRRGEPVPVEPQVFDLLLLLVQNAGKLITKDRMMEVVWDGRIVSEATVSARINAARKAVGDDGTKQAVIRTVSRRGIELIVPVTIDRQAAPSTPEPSRPTQQTIRYAKSDDGTLIAYTSHGQGPKALYAGHFLSHLELEWASTPTRTVLNDISNGRTLVRYDIRGSGLSDNDPADMGIQKQVDDLAAVADAAGLDRFPLVAVLQSSITALHFAAQNPNRVSRLVLLHGYCDGRAVRNSDRAYPEEDPFFTLMRDGFKTGSAAFVKAWSALILPDSEATEVKEVHDILQAATSLEQVIKSRMAIDQFSAKDILSKVSVPTLIIQSRNNEIHPFSEGRKLAGGIKDAEFAVMESSDGMCVPSSPTYRQQIDVINEFLDRDI